MPRKKTPEKLIDQLQKTLMSCVEHLSAEQANLMQCTTSADVAEQCADVDDALAEWRRVARQAHATAVEELHRLHGDELTYNQVMELEQRFTELLTANGQALDDAARNLRGQQVWTYTNAWCGERHAGMDELRQLRRIDSDLAMLAFNTFVETALADVDAKLQGEQRLLALGDVMSRAGKQTFSTTLAVVQATQYRAATED